jgi:hypothetical protein
MIDPFRRYKVTLGYWATVDGGDQLCRAWTFLAEEISEDDAIWVAIKMFRHEELQTWAGWPRDIFSIAVEPEVEL